MDGGDVFPVCSSCGTRHLEVHYETVVEELKVRERDVPKDERPADAEPKMQQRYTRRMKVRRETVLEVLRFLVNDFEAGIESEDTARALFGVFNPFLREIVNTMILNHVDWRGALAQLDKNFCLRYAKQLEEFTAWAENPDCTAKPAFIEPETNARYEPLSDPSVRNPHPVPDGIP